MPVAGDVVGQLISSLLVHPPPPSSFPHLPPPRHFADKAENLGKNGKDWKVAGKKKKAQKPAVIGTNETSGLKGVPPRSKSHWTFSVTRLDDHTTIDLVRRHLHQSGIEVIDVWLLNSQVKGTKTAKIKVAKEHRERAKNASIWPLHCRIKDWDFESAKNRHHKQKTPSIEVLPV